MVKLNELFDIKTGTNLELNKLEKVKCGVSNMNSLNFVSRTRKNNGVSAIVKSIPSIVPIPGGTITVAVGSSSVMEAFIQPTSFYSGRDLWCLIPKKNMKDEEKIFYCNCLRANKYKFNFGRQANKTLESLEVPELDEIPKWVYNTNTTIPLNFQDTKKKLRSLKNIEWKIFDLKDLFHIERGQGQDVKGNKKKSGETPFVSATIQNNGISAYTSSTPLYESNRITIANNGNGVCTAFYQPQKFIASSDVLVLTLKSAKEMDECTALFLTTLIDFEKYRFNYGRKLSVERANKLKIMLPIDEKGEINYIFMQKYIKAFKGANILK